LHPPADKGDKFRSGGALAASRVSLVDAEQEAVFGSKTCIERLYEVRTRWMMSAGRFFFCLLLKAQESVPTYAESLLP